jgi:hypothetical protein
MQWARKSSGSFPYSTRKKKKHDKYSGSPGNHNKLLICWKIQLGICIVISAEQYEKDGLRTNEKPHADLPSGN